MATSGIKFQPPRMPLVDPSNGIITRPWFLFLQAFFERSGGSSAMSYDDLIAAIEAAQAGDMVFQPNAGSSSPMLPDIMQSSCNDALAQEMTIWR